MKGFISILSSPKVWRPAGLGDQSFYEITAKTNNRFPTTTLGNDALQAGIAGRHTLGKDDTSTIGRKVISGFTLIELLVVVLIIGILAAAALPSYRVAVGTSRVATMYAFMRAVDQAQQHFYMQTNRYATNFDSLVIAVPAGFKKVSPERISSNDMGCYIMTSKGAAEISIKCTEQKNQVTLEKYHRNSFYICWAGQNDTLANRICQNLSGRDSPTGPSSDGKSEYLYNMN